MTSLLQQSLPSNVDVQLNPLAKLLADHSAHDNDNDEDRVERWMSMLPRPTRNDCLPSSGGLLCVSCQVRLHLHAEADAEP
eukprot:4638703-Amphidinium_carterae.1